MRSGTSRVMPVEQTIRPYVEPFLPEPRPRWSTNAGRLASIDLLRGLVMVVMALDHVRGYLSAARFDPTDLAQTSLPLFLTRWVTHYCAPTFILLAGMSAWIAGQRRSPRELSLFLLSRGLWLVVLEFTLVNFGRHFHVPFNPIVAQVMWAIGASMIILAGLVRLPRAAVAVIAVALIAGHNLFDSVQPADLGALAPLWIVLHVRAPIPSLGVMVVYPLLPWIGVMALGWVLGPLLRRPPGESRRRFFLLGAAMTLGWLVLRLANQYGDPVAWQVQDSATKTVMSFLAVTKYPPSLAFLLMTLGPALMALAVIDRVRGPIAAFLLPFGQVPLFYYVLHIYPIHALAMLVGAVQGFGPGVTAQAFTAFPQHGYGLSLPMVYLCWALVVVALYPLCRRFAEFKQRNRGAWWTSYV